MNSPTNEAGELRTAIYGTAFAIETYPDDFVLRINQKGFEDLLKLIQADKEKACLEARINELEVGIAWDVIEKGKEYDTRITALKKGMTE